MPPRRPLEDAIAAAQRDAAEAAALARAAEAKVAALLIEQARLVDAVVAAEKALHHRVNSSTVTGEQMQADTRSIAISEGRSGRDPFLKAIRAKGFTLRSLAARVDTPPSLLSMQRKGERPIPQARAEKIEELTGWPADRKHWPGGLS